VLAHEDAGIDIPICWGVRRRRGKTSFVTLSAKTETRTKPIAVNYIETWLRVSSGEPSNGTWLIHWWGKLYLSISKTNPSPYSATPKHPRTAKRCVSRVLRLIFNYFHGVTVPSSFCFHFLRSDATTVNRNDWCFCFLYPNRHAPKTGQNGPESHHKAAAETSGRWEEDAGTPGKSAVIMMTGKSSEPTKRTPGKTSGWASVILGDHLFPKKLCRNAVFGPKYRLDAPNANHRNAPKCVALGLARALQACSKWCDLIAVVPKWHAVAPATPRFWYIKVVRDWQSPPDDRHFFLRNSREVLKIKRNVEVKKWVCWVESANTMRRTATHCNTLQHTATHNSLQHTAYSVEAKSQVW